MKIQLLNTPRAKAPKLATPGSAGFDCFARIEEPYSFIALNPGEVQLVGLGFRMEVPKGYGAMLLPRSGKGSKGLVLGNLVGLIDSDYTGEVKACLWNRSETETFEILNGDAICQMVIVPVLTPELELVKELTKTIRGDGGFGSTDN
jgi:dUTP pyrophosphatase